MAERRLRGARLAAAVLALAVASAGAIASPAGATTSGSGWWLDTYGVDAIHAEGWTGDGVKVAVIDSGINPDLPVFAGQNLTVAEGALCEGAASAATQSTGEGFVHGTTVTAMINGNGTGAGSVRGIAPGADVTFYGQGSNESCRPAEHPNELTSFGYGLQRAIDDGARIVSYSGGYVGAGPADADVVANAIAKGVVLVSSMPNAGPGSYEYAEFPWSFNGAVSVAAVDSAGQLQSDSSAGDAPLALAGTTVVAAGVDFPTVGVADESWDASDETSGSSFAAPLVAGMLAVVAQRYPDATGNQLIQTLIRNTDLEDHELAYDATGGYGYGAAWLDHMLRVDPTQYADTNPLMDRPSGVPSAEQVEAAAARGSALPDFSRDSFSEYEEDGAGEAAPASEPAPQGGGLPILWIVIAVIVVAVIGGVILALVLASTRKNRTPQGGPS